MEQQLAVRKQLVSTMDEAERAATAMAKSGYFQDATGAAQCLTKILAGMEMGFGPFASMTGVHIIQGKPTVGANLMGAAVKSSGRYNYRVTEMTDKACEITFFEGREQIGISRFTIDDGRKAGTKNLDKYPRNMLFARAMSNGVKWYCPDVLNGNPIYTPEEMGADVDEEGNYIDVKPTFTEETTTTKPTTNGNGNQPETTTAQNNRLFKTVVHRPATVVTQTEPEILDQFGFETDTTQPAEPVYTGVLAKVGKNKYPPKWAQAVAAYTRANDFECDGILQKLRLPQDTHPTKVIDALNKYLDGKKKITPELDPPMDDGDMPNSPKDGLPFGDR